MELKNVNPNGNNVVAKKIEHHQLFFWKIVKIEFKNELYMLCCLKNFMIA
jgi:hypothetical protein